MCPQSLCSAVVQVYGADKNSSWVKKCSGVACLVKDSTQRSYFIRVFDIKVSQQMLHVGQMCFLWFPIYHLAISFKLMVSYSDLTGGTNLVWSRFDEHLYNKLLQTWLYHICWTCKCSDLEPTSPLPGYGVSVHVFISAVNGRGNVQFSSLNCGHNILTRGNVIMGCGHKILISANFILTNLISRGHEIILSR